MYSYCKKLISGFKKINNLFFTDNCCSMQKNDRHRIKPRVDYENLFCMELNCHAPTVDFCSANSYFCNYYAFFLKREIIYQQNNYLRSMTEVASRDVTELEEVIVQGEPRTGVSSRVSRMPVVPFGIPKLATEIFIMNPLFHSSQNYPLFKQCVTYHNDNDFFPSDMLTCLLNISIEK